MGQGEAWQGGKSGCPTGWQGTGILRARSFLSHEEKKADVGYGYLGPRLGQNAGEMKPRECEPPYQAWLGLQGASCNGAGHRSCSHPGFPTRVFFIIKDSMDKMTYIFPVLAAER